MSKITRRDEPITLAHAYRFAERAITEKQAFALHFKGQDAFVTAPTPQAGNVERLIQETKQ